MIEYNFELLSSMSDISNMLPLRADVQVAFDNQTFIFTPKRSRWVVHFLNSTHELGPQFHNTAVEIGQIASPEFLLARFAWAIFPSANAELSYTCPRR